MKHLTLALMFSAGDAPRAETLLDWIYQLNNKTQHDNPLLLVAASNVHAEMQVKVRIAAELAFKHVELAVANNTDAEKVMSFNRLFRATAQTVKDRYSLPWLLLEPDCVPLKADWIEHLELAYHSQPKRFFGPHLKFQVRDEEKMCVGKVAVYPNDAANDLNGFCDTIVPFNQLAGELIVPRSTKTRLIQQLDIAGEEDSNKVRPDAVLFHSDKTGAIIRRLQSQPVPDVLPAAPVEVAVEKIDGRTKEGRARKAALAVA